jgi:serine/threonine-protein kinase
VTDTPSDLLDHQLGRYHLDRLLGQGGFAWVFAARDGTGRPSAVKVLKPRYAGDPQFESRFRRENEIAAQLDHPNVIRISPLIRQQSYLFFAMDLCADSLAARLAREGPLPEPALIRVIRDVCRGLGFAHARGVIHRDLKPDNVLLHPDGTAVLSDFGIARAASGTPASTGVNLTMGTPHYLSPEQAQGRPLDQRADFYALGVTLYKAATGHVPFSAADWYELARMHVEDRPTPPRRHRPDLSRRLERIVLKCLAKHPDDRYRDAAELLAELDERVPGQPDTPPPGVAERRAAARPGRRLPWTLIAAVGVALALLGLAIRGLLR